MESYYRQTSGDIGNPFEYGANWDEFKLTDGIEQKTGGFMEMLGNDAGGPENMCYCEYKHVSKSGNIKRHKGFRTEKWVNEWIATNDIDCC